MEVLWIRTLIVIEPDCDAIMNCNSAMKYSSYQVTASFPESILNGDNVCRWFIALSTMSRAMDSITVQDVHSIWASISRRTNQASYFHMVARISTTVIAQGGLRKACVNSVVRRCI
jgi:hypothetical protein